MFTLHNLVVLKIVTLPLLGAMMQQCCISEMRHLSHLEDICYSPKCNAKL